MVINSPVTTVLVPGPYFIYFFLVPTSELIRLGYNMTYNYIFSFTNRTCFQIILCICAYVFIFMEIFLRRNYLFIIDDYFNINVTVILCNVENIGVHKSEATA